MHLGQAGLDLDNVYLKYHTGALTARITLRTCSYLHKSQDFNISFQRIKGSLPCQLSFHNGTI